VRRLTDRLREIRADLSKLEVPIRNLPMDWFQPLSMPVYGASGLPVIRESAEVNVGRRDHV
jgi:hypothetical protein